MLTFALTLAIRADLPCLWRTDNSEKSFLGSKVGVIPLKLFIALTAYEGCRVPVTFDPPMGGAWRTIQGRTDSSQGRKGIGKDKVVGFRGWNELVLHSNVYSLRERACMSPSA